MHYGVVPGHRHQHLRFQKRQPPLECGRWGWGVVWSVVALMQPALFSTSDLADMVELHHAPVVAQRSCCTRRRTMAREHAH